MVSRLSSVKSQVTPTDNPEINLWHTPGVTLLPQRLPRQATCVGQVTLKSRKGRVAFRAQFAVFGLCRGLGHGCFGWDGVVQNE